MKILALGTCCVDVYPQKDTMTPGGEALNISVHLSLREDVQVHLMGMIGNDAYAQAILENLQGFSIHCEHLYQVEGETAHHVIMIDDQGDRYFERGSWHGGVSADLSLNKADKAMIAEMDAVITTLWEPNLKELLDMKTQNHYLVAVDFNQQRDLSPWEALIDDIDIFFCSAEDSMRDLFQARSKTSKTLFVLTFGAYGSVAYHQGQTFACPASEVANVIDTTGCGDCYQGHFVVEYLKTGDIAHAMKKSALEAAKVATYLGGFPAN